MANYSKEEVIGYLSHNLKVLEEKLSVDAEIYSLVRDSLALFDLELSLESRFSQQEINLREKTRTVGDLVCLLTC